VKRDEAKLELDAATLRPQDASAEARAMLESDAELARWHERRAAFDETVADAFQETVADPEIRQRILQAAARTPAKRPLRWLTPTAFSAAAACIAFGWLLFWPAGNAMSAWESESLAAIAKLDEGLMGLDETAASYDALIKHLNDSECPCPGGLPPALISLRTYGCKRVQIEGRGATIICFEIQPGKEAHLIVLDRTDLCDCPDFGEPSFKSSKSWSYASWSHGSQAFMLATTADAAALKQLFGLA